MGLYNNRIVVKVGTSTLTNDAGKSDLRTTDRLVCVLSDIQNMGYEVVLVSSGAIAVGRNKLNMTAKPDSMRMKQAAAAVGQCSLMYLYDKFFGDYDKTVAQILLNADDIEEEEKKEIRHGKLVAVATGKVLAMTQAKDEAFATCAMGDGVVIEPEKGVVVAPADGKITALMKPSYMRLESRQKKD